MFNRTNGFYNTDMMSVPAMYWQRIGLTLSYPYRSI